MSDISESDMFVGNRWDWARAMNGDNPDHYEPDLTGDEDEDDERDVEDNSDREEEDSDEEDGEGEGNDDSNGDETPQMQQAVSLNGENRAIERPENTASNNTVPAAEQHRSEAEAVQVGAAHENEDAENEDEDDEASRADHGLDEITVKGNLQKVLDDIESFGSFASFGPIPEFHDPGIMLETGSPPITLPLQEPDAQRLIAASHRAPFGRGVDTILDDSVRKTWELNVDQFVVNNPYFNNTVHNAVTTAMAGLGVANMAQVGVAPYKMLLYEKGALFKPHTDTEKVPGQFATLVICLPSVHEGGNIVLSHKGTVKHFSTSTMQSSYACWYSDVTHEVEEVTSGYRLVLTYNIYKTPALTTELSASKTLECHPDLKSALRDWRWSLGTEAIYILEHKYTDVSLNVHSLKGEDVGRVQALLHFAAKYKYWVFFASMEHMESGDAEDDYDPYDRYGRYGGDDSEEDEDEYESGGVRAIDSIIDKETKLKRIVALDGTQLATDMNIDESILLAEGAFDGDPDDHEYEGYTGNAGAQSTHWYRDTVVVLVPSERLVQWLTNGFVSYSYYRKNITPLLDWLVKGYDQSSGPKKAAARVHLVQFCEFIIKENSGTSVPPAYGARPDWLPFPQNVVASVLGILARLQEYRTLASAIASGSRFLSKEAFQVLSPMMNGKFAQIKNALTEVFREIKSVNVTFEALTALFGGNLDNRTGEAADWASDVLTRAVRYINGPTEQDGKALVSIAICLRRADFLQDCIRECLMCTNDTKFMLGFLAALITDGKIAFSEAEITSAVIKCYIPTIRGFYLEAAESHPYKRVRTTLEPNRADATTTSTTASNISSLLGYLLGNNIANADLFTTLETQSRGCQVNVLRQILIPFLREAQPLARQYVGTEYGPKFHSLYTTIIKSYLERFVQHQPSTFENFARSRVNCSCKDCFEVNLFLPSPTQQEGRYLLSKARRHHLHQMLERSSANCTHLTRPGSSILVVTKISQVKGALDAWLSRCQEAGEQLQKFDTATLRSVLGNRYEDIVTMVAIVTDRTKVPEVLRAISRSLPLAEMPNPHLPPLRTGSKRKVEVIDLCGDSD